MHIQKISLGIFLLLGGYLFSQTTEKPNIIIILTDDMGYTDVSPYGSEISTPNLDFLANNGLRYSDFYVTPRCSPTRACLLTGQYSHAAGMGHLTGNAQNNNPGFANDLERQNVSTIPEMLKTVGYRSHIIGKWHVAREREKDTPFEKKYNWPLQRGFDQFYGTIVGGGSFYDPGMLTRDNTPISPFSDAEQAIYPKRLFTVAAYDEATQIATNNPNATPSDSYYHYTDAISDQTVRYINEHFQNPNTKDQPLFQYVAYTSAHWPLHGIPEDQESYNNVYNNGYAPIREARFQKVKQDGLVSLNTQLPQMDQDNWSTMTPEMRWYQEMEMKTYAGMITQMDRGIGRIIDALRTNEQLENTLILYMHDNGGNHEGGHSPNTVSSDLPYRPNNPVLPTRDKNFIVTGVRPTQTRDGYKLRGPDGGRPTRNVGAPDTYEYGSKQWGNVSNTPFQEYKSDASEGGIASPLIAYWGNGISENLKGSVVKDPSHLIDIMATIQDITKASYSNDKRPLAGVSLSSHFTGGSINRGKPLFWEHEGWQAVRDGKWKILTKGAISPWELYDMENDRSETNDLALQHPEIVERLADEWDRWASENQVVPWPWGNRYAPKPLPRVWYVLKNRDSGLNMRVQDCKTDWETKLELFDGTGDCAQWTFINNNGVYTIKNRISDLNIRHDAENVVSDQTLAEMINTNFEKTHFEVIPAGTSGYYNLRHRYSRLSLRNNDCERVNDETLIEFFDGFAECAQWELIPVGIITSNEEFDNIDTEITLHPNPSTGVFKIDLKYPIEKIEVFNINSQSVLKINGATLKNNEADLSSLNSGIYWLKISYDNKIYQVKIIKQ